jgi:hypothetical protein
MASMQDRSMETPSGEMMKLRNSMEVRWNSHFSAFAKRRPN